MNESYWITFDLHVQSKSSAGYITESSIPKISILPPKYAVLIGNTAPPQI